jgi:DNA polymerase-3 subunit gamma/tau
MGDFIVSARKYRPATFESVVGQKSVTTTLQNAIRTNHLAHAYLFFGPRGVGKTTCARIFAKTINCLNPGTDMDACNRCESCLAFDQSRSYNIHELDAASNNSVEDIRNLIDMVRIPPQIGKYSVFIIDEVHMLSASAFNAFLKTLEEPPKHAIFILATTEKHKILPTILSRCQVFDFNRINNSDIVGYLKYVARSENIDAEPEGLSVIAQKAEGAMRDALSFFDQIVSFSGSSITYQHVISNLNVLDYEYFFKLTDYFIENNVAESLLVYDEILRKGFDGQHFLSGLAKHFRNLLVSRQPETIQLMEVGEKIGNQYKRQSSQLSPKQIFLGLEIANSADLSYRTSNNSRLHVELALVKCCYITDSHKSNADPIVEKTASTDNKTVINRPLPPAVSTTISQKPIEKPATTQNAPTSDVATKSENSTGTSGSSIPKRSVIPSIKGVYNAEAIPKKEADVKEPEKAFSIFQKSFSETELYQVWTAYGETLREINPRLKTFIDNHKPNIDSEGNISILVENESLAGAFKDVSQELTLFFRNNLKNNLLQIKTQVSENVPSQRIIYTQQDKLDFLKQKNPNLSKFTETFQLDFE